MNFLETFFVGQNPILRSARFTAELPYIWTIFSERILQILEDQYWLIHQSWHGLQLSGFHQGYQLIILCKDKYKQALPDAPKGSE